MILFLLSVVLAIATIKVAKCTASLSRKVCASGSLTEFLENQRPTPKTYKQV